MMFTYDQVKEYDIKLYPQLTTSVSMQIEITTPGASSVFGMSFQTANNVIIDWGDSSPTDEVNGDTSASNTYTSPGTYTIGITGFYSSVAFDTNPQYINEINSLTGAPVPAIRSSESVTFRDQIALEFFKTLDPKRFAGPNATYNRMVEAYKLAHSFLYARNYTKNL